MRMEETVSVRVPSDLLKSLGRLAAETHATRSDLLRDALALGLEAKRLDLALSLYRARTISLGRAAKVAGLPIPLLLDRLKGTGTVLNYTREDLAQDLAWARRK